METWYDLSDSVSVGLLDKNKNPWCDLSVLKFANDIGGKSFDDGVLFLRSKTSGNDYKMVWEVSYE